MVEIENEREQKEAARGNNTTPTANWQLRLYDGMHLVTIKNVGAGTASWTELHLGEGRQRVDGGPFVPEEERVVLLAGTDRINRDLQSGKVHWQSRDGTEDSRPLSRA